MTVVREDLIGEEHEHTPLLCSWATYAKAPQTFHNTPCCWSIYMAGVNLEYMINQGLDSIKEAAAAKSKTLYDAIEGSDGYYTNPVDAAFRSRMNIPFRVAKNEDLEKKFIAEAREAGLIELKGHRSVGGIRISIYNGMT